MALEPGAGLDEQASLNLADFPHATVVNGSFEEKQGEPSGYDAVVAATAWPAGTNDLVRFRGSSLAVLLPGVG